MRFQQYHSGRNYHLPIFGHHQRQKGPKQVHKRSAENPIGTGKYRSRQLLSEIRRKNREIKNPKTTQQTVHQETNRSNTTTKHENENKLVTRRENYQTGTAAFAENRPGHWKTYARHGDHNATFAKRWDILPTCANPRPSTG